MTTTLSDIETAAVKLARMLPHLLRGEDVLAACQAVERHERELGHATALAEMDRERERKAYAEMLDGKLTAPLALAPTDWSMIKPARAGWYTIDADGSVHYWQGDTEPTISVTGNQWTCPLSGWGYAGKVNIPLGVDWRILKYRRPVDEVIAAAPQAPAKARRTRKEKS